MASLEVVLGSEDYCYNCLIYINYVLGFILLMYLEIFVFMEAENILVVHDSPKGKFPWAFCVGQSCARFHRRKIVYSKIAVVKR